jgi:O-antigen biosynthesis protein WbqP
VEGALMLLKRFFDIFISLLMLIILSIPLLVIALLVRLTSKGPALYWSNRVGIRNEIFSMPKFRSMFIDTPEVATHLLKNSNAVITPLGKFLRRTSLDELPQLISVIKGDMSLVGPRPALFNQDDLISLRTTKGIDRVKPGVTGWAQINGRDDLPIPVKVEFDLFYVNQMSFLLDLKILFLTAFKILKSDGIQH